ncbi:hypothetical protein AGMMS4957_08270 [Bacteroidia bacterium]|nr:hypothetical protein AGMMS4957_08270 [Bacteroidia bacterium]
MGTGSVTAATSYTLTGSGNNRTLTITGTGKMEGYRLEVLPNGTETNTAPWYSSRASIKTVVINSGVTSIGIQAFYGCSSLTSVTIPNSVTSIETMAFYGCSGLTSVTIPNSVSQISRKAFRDCSTLTTVNFNATYCSIMGSSDEPVFSNCPALRTVNIGNNVTCIGKYAFYGCSGLTSITIPSSVTSVGERAFYGCNTLTTVNFNATNCTTGGYSVFSNCPALRTVNIGNNVTKIPDRAFSGCSGLTSVTIPNPNSVTSIEDYAFSGCSGLTSITIPNSVTSIGEGAFYGCSGLTLTSITIPNSVTSIGDYAFRDCSTLTTVNFNATNCTKMGSPARPVFSNCPALRTVNIGNNVTRILSGAFHSCSGLTSVTIPNSVTSIEGGAFYGCSGLTSITIPSNVTSIGDYAFSGCGLTSITIPSSVTSIEGCAFRDCSTLTTVNFNATNCTTMGSYNNLVFSNCPALRTVNIGNNVTKIPDYAFSGCSGLTSVTIPNDVTSIGEGAFSGCSTLTTVNFNATNCTTMGGNYYSVFSNCPALRTVNVGNNVTRISGQAFSGCSSLTAINVGAANTQYSSIEGVMYNKNKTTLVRYPEGKQGAFTIPNSVTSIEQYVFSGCSGLTSVTCLAATPPSIGINNFTVSANTLYVPASSLSAYQGNSDWSSKFSSILALVTLNKTTDTLTIGGTVQLTAIVAPITSNRAVTWSSSNTAVATVNSSTGLVSAVSAGSATITATSQDGGYTASCEVTVKAKASQSISWSQTLSAYYGGSPITLIATTSSGLTVDYASSNTDVATISGNTLTIVGIGSSTITASQAGNNTYNAATNVTETLTVAKAAGTFVSTSAVNTTYTAGLTLADITLPANYAWQTPTTAVNAGNGQTFTAIYTDLSGNYEAAAGNVTVNVAKATPSVTYPTQATVQSGAALATAVFTGGSSDVSGAFAFSSASTIPALSNSNTTNYELVFTPTDSANYNATTKPDMKVTVVSSSDATLSSLAVTGYSISPAFDANTTVYTLTVPNGVNSVTIEATTTDSKSVTGTGSKFIAVGENPFTITVTAEDGATTKEYLLIVTRQEANAALSSNASLSTLSVEGYAISPMFDVDILGYTLTVPNAVSSITINATKADSKASVAGVGIKPIDVGSIEFAVVVTAEDGAQKIYTITITREAENSATAVATQNIISLQIYPNPVRDWMTIVSDEWNVGDKVKIYNLAGALVEATHVSPLQGNTTTIDIAHLPAGIYIVKVGNKSAKVVKK